MPTPESSAMPESSSVPASGAVPESSAVPKSPAMPESSPKPESGAVPEAPSEKPFYLRMGLIKKLEDDFGSSFRDLLATRYGISLRFDNVVAWDGAFTATLILENDSGSTYEKEIRGELSFVSPYHSIDTLVVNWGGVCVVDSGAVAVITLDSVSLVGARSLAETPFPPDLSVLGESMNAVGVGRDGEGYIVAAVSRIRNSTRYIDSYQESLFFFDANGKLKDTVTLGESGNFSRPRQRLQELQYAEQMFTPSWENGRVVVIPNLMMAYPLDNAANGGSRFTARFDDAERTLLVADIPGSGGTAFLYERDIQTGAASLPVVHPAIFYPEDWSDKAQDTGVRWDTDKTAVISNAYFDTAITVDFAKAAADAVFTLDTGHIFSHDLSAQSPEGRYRIVESSSWGEDDVPMYYSNAWLHDTASDRYEFIDVFASYYGGNGDRCGFFSESRFYRMDFPEQLTIYDIADSSPRLSLTLSDNAVAVAYAADRGLYYVLELEYATENEDARINAAVWDDGGNLIERHKTAIPIAYHLEGFYQPDISVSGGTLYYESPSYYYESPEDEVIQSALIKGVLDLTTFEFQETSREKLD
jgi:hypothetical protein